MVITQVWVFFCWFYKKWVTWVPNDPSTIQSYEEITHFHLWWLPVPQRIFVATYSLEKSTFWPQKGCLDGIPYIRTDSLVSGDCLDSSTSLLPLYKDKKIVSWNSYWTVVSWSPDWDWDWDRLLPVICHGTLAITTFVHGKLHGNSVNQQKTERILPIWLTFPPCSSQKSYSLWATTDLDTLVPTNVVRKAYMLANCHTNENKVTITISLLRNNVWLVYHDSW